VTTTERWVVVGASGFVGTRIARAAADRGIEVVGIARRLRPEAPRVTRAVDLAAGDRVIDDLGEAFEGATTVIHAGSYIGSDAEQAHETNVLGTARLLEAVRRAGSPRIVSIGTASVVGTGPHRGARPHDGDRRPESVTSRSRAEAEASVIAAGGTVVRPNLVYGPGDVWFVPTLMRLLRTDARAAEAWTAQVSTVHVDDLAAAVVGLGGDRGSHRRGQAVFVGATTPSRMADVGAVIARDILGAGTSLGGGEPGHQDPGLSLSAHQRALLEVDNWFDTVGLWQRLALPEARAFTLGPRDLDWYRSLQS
jgi:nucleoside-diphosphate-sugar epimerase